MALEIADRVKETTTTTSTGTYTLAGAVDGFQSFAAVGDGNTTYYACTDGTDYEVGVGSYTASGTTLSRVTILESSNSDAAVNWGAGTKEIFVTVPAEKYLVRDASGNVSLTGNLTISGTVDGRDVAADGSKLDGIESGATADQTAAQIRAKVEAASDSNVFTDADHTKLNGIEANAKDDQTITAGSGLTGGGTGDVTLSHADTSSQSSVNNSGRTYIQDITLDGYGHVTGISSATETVTNTNTNQLTTFVVEDGDGTEVTISHGKEWKFVEGTSIDINWTDTDSGTDGDPYDLTISHADTSTLSGTYGSTSNGTKIDQITVDAQGHVTAITTGACGDIQGVTAGSGLTGGGTSGTVTISHADTSSQASVNNSGRTYIQDITLDTYGHITGITSATETVTNTNTNQLTTFQVEDGDGTEVTISHGKEWKFVEAGGININWTDTSTGSDGDPYDLSFNVTSAPKWGTARTLSLSGDASGSVSWDGSANATLSVAVSNDSHTHAFNNLTSKTSGTGDYATTGNLQSGKNSGGVALTINDGYGNANVTWNHMSGVPEQNGQSARIEVNTDSTTGEGEMSFEVSSAAVTSGTAVTLPTGMTLAHDYLEIPNLIRHAGDTDTYLQFHNANEFRIVTGGTEMFEVNDTNIIFNCSASFGSNTINDIEDIYLRDRIYHDGDTNTYMQFHAADQWRVVVGGTERLEVKNSSPHVLVSGDLNSTSDARLKENVKPIANALSDITQLEGVSFDWKDTGTRGHGFIAQQVEPILPDVVNTDDETGIKSINYVGMIGHLVEAIKELKAEIEELKRQ